MSDKSLTPELDKRGGYGSSNKAVAELKPPPSGPAPGSRERAPELGETPDR